MPRMKRVESREREEIANILGEHNRKAIADVARATGWSIAAVRSIAGEEIEHGLRHRPYSYAIRQRAKVRQFKATKWKARA